MKKLTKILVFASFTLSLWFTSIANANVDATTMADFDYDGNTCMFKSDLNLWGHHKYIRKYKIIEPGIITMWDAKHTTFWLNRNGRIQWCAEYKPKTCNINPNSRASTKTFWDDLILTFGGKWITVKVIEDSYDRIVVELSNPNKEEITTTYALYGKIGLNPYINNEKKFQFSISKINNKITYRKLEEKDEKSVVVKEVKKYENTTNTTILEESKEKTSLAGKVVQLDKKISTWTLNTGSLEKETLPEYVIEKVSEEVVKKVDKWTPWTNFYTWNTSRLIIKVDEKNKTIKLQSQKLVFTNTIKSFDWVKKYRAIDWENFIIDWTNLNAITDWAHCKIQDYKGKNFDYCTWLDMWDYEQHNYTTTDIVLHPVDVECTVEVDNCTWLDNPSYAILSRCEKNLKARWWENTFSSIQQGDLDFSDSLINGEYRFVDSSTSEPRIEATEKFEISWIKIAKDWTIPDNDKCRTDISTWWYKTTVCEKKARPVTKIILYVLELQKWQQITIAESNPEEFNPWQTLANKNFRTIDFKMKEADDRKKFPFVKAWNYKLRFYIYSGDDLLWQLDSPLKIFPANTVKKSENWLTKSWEAFANLIEKFKIEQKIVDKFWNEIKPKPAYKDNIKIVSEWNNDLVFTNTTFWDSKLSFEVSSLTPKNYKDVKVKVKIPKHKIDTNLPATLWYKNWLEFGGSGNWNNGNNWNNWNITNGYILIDLGDLNFKKPLVAESIEISNDNWVTWGAIPEIGREQLYKFIVKDKWALGNIVNWIIWGKVGDDFKKFFNLPQWVVFKVFEVVKPKPIKPITNFNWENGLEYRFKITLWIDWEQNASKAKNWLSISVKWLYVSYFKNWKFTKYKLDEFRTADSCPVKTLWVKLIWGGQATWDIANTTDSAANITDMSKLDLKWDIKKSVNNLVRWLKSGAVVNRVKYVVGDVNITWNDYFRDFETLVVRNWNVYISKDIATNSKNLYGIIVLNDDFDVIRNVNSEGTKISGKWNIFVNKDVTEINAVVYADGWFISADNNGTIYKDHELNKALKFKWSLFTKNTIWGSIVNKLPGGKIWKYEVSRVYDLNNTRKVPVKCENGKVLDNPSFTIEYDAKIQSNPPKGFSK